MFFLEKKLKAEILRKRRRINGWGGGKERTRYKHIIWMKENT